MLHAWLHGWLLQWPKDFPMHKPQVHCLRYAWLQPPVFYAKKITAAQHGTSHVRAHGREEYCKDLYMLVRRDEQWPWATSRWLPRRRLSESEFAKTNKKKFDSESDSQASLNPRMLHVLQWIPTRETAPIPSP